MHSKVVFHRHYGLTLHLEDQEEENDEEVSSNDDEQHDSDMPAGPLQRVGAYLWCLKNLTSSWCIAY
ncbi:hypothetical protein DEO72_LG2g3828 [Vigna unguiculata]|uniref:Uncharacterized protein n=1 Tax=Vigna unguiculata TaxID=3917 RepID=A0A4D6L4Y1_VIGUN|nr:hypothetical protein DEO72_LG2g3828 [Vigna unguiculata]